jgi:hypothetical protein
MHYSSDTVPEYLGIATIFICTTAAILFLNILEIVQNENAALTSLVAIQKDGVVLLNVYIP